MNSKISEFLKRPYALLAWALICGCAYLSIIGRFVMSFTSTAARGNIILWFFFPAIICGAALILVKSVKHAQENENTRAVLLLFYTHLIIIAMAVVFLLDFIL
ncbi:MAG: hypothetical protein LUD03_05590 [Firmicutes bacterium]|nr:hypothetical protein [Bacillota bacterium]